MQASNFKPLGTLLNGRSIFFQEFLKHPFQIGSIIPSSRFLERRTVEAARVRSAKTIVELGPGTGGTTRAILHSMTSHARLLCIEINPNFHAILNCIKDDRLKVHLGSATEIKEILHTYGMAPPEVVISGIPFSTMSHALGSQIIESVSSTLAPGGRFVAYQVSKRVASLCRPILGSGQVEAELFNIPPMRVYRWEKKNGA
ncbi:MAG: methyltransferase type 12 [Deltaproteobacteria bacterium]|nr:MAG: methyltransferase type 12 [Deltaproteobacteria bacterium]